MEPELLKTWEAFADKYEENWTDYEAQVWEEAKSSNLSLIHISDTFSERRCRRLAGNGKT